MTYHHQLMKHLLCGNSKHESSLINHKWQLLKWVEEVLEEEGIPYVYQGKILNLLIINFVTTDVMLYRYQSITNVIVNDFEPRE